jgi:lysophospholipase L1-like esterase
MSKRHEFCSIALEELEDRILMSAGVPLPSTNLVATTPTPSSYSWSTPLHQFYLYQLHQGSADVAFLGDSITFGWGDTAHPYLGTATWNAKVASLNADNFGVPGDQTQNLIWRLQNGELSDKPKVAVVMIGTNNLGVGGQTPAQTAAGVAAVLDTIHTLSPQTKVLLFGILPRSANPTDTLRVEVAQTNVLLSKLSNGRNVEYLDISSGFVLPNGQLNTALFARDDLHPNAQGYQVWGAALAGPLRSLLGAHATMASAASGASFADPAGTASDSDTPVVVNTDPSSSPNVIPGPTSPVTVPPQVDAVTSLDLLLTIVSVSTGTGAPGDIAEVSSTSAKHTHDILDAALESGLA